MSPSLSASMLSVPSELEMQSQPLYTPDALDVSVSHIQLVTIENEQNENDTKDIIY